MLSGLAGGAFAWNVIQIYTGSRLNISGAISFIPPKRQDEPYIQDRDRPLCDGK